MTAPVLAAETVNRDLDPRRDRLETDLAATFTFTLECARLRAP